LTIAAVPLPFRFRVQPLGSFSIFTEPSTIASTIHDRSLMAVTMTVRSASMRCFFSRLTYAVVKVLLNSRVQRPFNPTSGMKGS
jgi:hypothetical protein